MPKLINIGRLNLSRILWYLGLIILALYFGLPLLWLFLAPSKTNNELIFLNPLAFGTFERIVEAWNNLMTIEDGIIITWLANSIYYTITALVISIGISLPAGYALAKMKFAGRKLLLWLTLITMIVPGSALVLPIFLELALVKLLNSAWSVILPASFFPFGVYLSYIFYKVSLPKELLEAAQLDGASDFQVFQYMGVPLARSLIGVLTFLSFSANWNNFFLPYVMLNKSALYNLPVGLNVIMTGTSALRATMGTDLPLYRAELALAGVMLVLPVMFVFLFAQRFLTSGMLTGTIKG